jgi:hypothetical protein
MSTLILILLLILVLGGLPNWGFHNMGYAPTGISGALLLIVVVLLLTGRL